MRHTEDHGPTARIKLTTLARAWKIVSEYKRMLMIIALMVILSSTLMGTLPLILRHIVDDVLPQKNGLLIFKIGSVYFALLITSLVIQFAQEITAGLVGIEIVAKLKQKLFKHVLTLSINFFDKNGAGKLIGRIESDSDKLNMFFSAVSVQFLSATLSIIISLTAMMIASPKLGVLALGIAPLCIGGMLLIFTKMRPWFRHERELYSRITSFLGEHIRAIPLLRTLNQLQWSRNKLRKINQDKFKFTLKMFIVEEIVWFAVLIIPQLVIALILYKSVGAVAAGTISVGTVWMFVQYLERIVQPIYVISEQIAEIQKALGAADRIFDLLDENNPMKDGDRLIQFREEIKFDQVSFRYSEDKPVLKNVSFTIKKGETVAIVGPTGSGKTTLFSLLARFYDPDNGRILIDGIDTKLARKDSLRSNMSMVLQDTFLFAGDVINNLKLGRKDIDDNQVIKAAKELGVWSFISKWPQQEKTKLIEEGGNLSHGERQLLSFSRAMTFDPQILLLDEATSSIDTKTEKFIQAKLKELTRGRTAIIIAHRLSTIQEADKIIYLKDGVIEEIGDHKELIAKEGYYQELFATQTMELI